jgi:hypothetical protein
MCQKEDEVDLPRSRTCSSLFSFVVGGTSSRLGLGLIEKMLQKRITYHQREEPVTNLFVPLQTSNPANREMPLSEIDIEIEISLTLRVKHRCSTILAPVVFSTISPHLNACL